MNLLLPAILPKVELLKKVNLQDAIKELVKVSIPFEAIGGSSWRDWSWGNGPKPDMSDPSDMARLVASKVLGSSGAPVEQDHGCAASSSSRQGSPDAWMGACS